MPTATDITAVWSQVLDIVRDELNTPSFKTWFEHTAPIEITDDGRLWSVSRTTSPARGSRTDTPSG